MHPDAAHDALLRLERHTITPRDANQRSEVLRAFNVLYEIARMWRDTTTTEPTHLSR